MGTLEHVPEHALHLGTLLVGTRSALLVCWETKTAVVMGGVSKPSESQEQSPAVYELFELLRRLETVTFDLAGALVKQKCHLRQEVPSDQSFFFIGDLGSALPAQYARRRDTLLSIALTLLSRSICCKQFFFCQYISLIIGKRPTSPANSQYL